MHAGGRLATFNAGRAQKVFRFARLEHQDGQGGKAGQSRVAEMTGEGMPLDTQIFDCSLLGAFCFSALIPMRRG